MTNLVFNFFN